MKVRNIDPCSKILVFLIWFLDPLWCSLEIEVHEIYKFATQLLIELHFISVAEIAASTKTCKKKRVVIASESRYR